MSAPIEIATRVSDGRRKRGQPKGRGVNEHALARVSGLIDSPPRRDRLIEYLHKIQDSIGYLPSDEIVALARLLKISPVEVYEVATFYHHFDVVKDNESPPAPLTVRVCDSVSCEIAGANTLIESLQSALGKDVRVQRVPCVGRCDRAPVATIHHRRIDDADLDRVIEAATNPESLPLVSDESIRLDAYIDAGGYELLQSITRGESGVDKILDELESSGLRGLGGAGFPAGRKWRIVRDFDAPRLMAINIDEGEPGTFKDRYYLERDPHRFIEGMLIAAHVVGIDQCYVYVRDEYPGVLALLREEIDALAATGRFDLPKIELRRGAGAYICGEESAMIESIEGKRGMPRLRPPYVAEVGLFGRPTLEHNCETLFWVRDILQQGDEAFAAHGRHGRTGLRSFSVSGRVKNPGVYLAPAGITLNELIDEYCGGMQDGHKLHAYFPGGASGGILPASLANVPMDFDTLQEYGCFIGSAAVMVLSDQDRARDAALNAMAFFAHESCGQCTPCRVGTIKAVDLMKHETWDAGLLEELCEVMADASICGLGQAAPNPIRCIIKYFPDEVGVS
ncbi:MAG: NADH-quinone oxidoreductase subunit F [marine bacterium B5-7]|nr:MAG: NADH-quinone oxidoreductase subunit F [marine bacterium B5-7]